MYRYARVLGIDPGGFLGVADTLFKDNKLHVNRTNLYHINLMLNEIKYTEPFLIPEIVLKYKVLEKIITEPYMQDINYFVVEDSYAYIHKITAFKSLNTYIQLLELLIYKYYKKRLIKIHNRLVKHVLVGKKTSIDKIEIQEAILNNKDIIIDKSIDTKYLTEHEFDAISLAYGFCKKYLRL